jgi:hypothetical protein
MKITLLTLFLSALLRLGFSQTFPSEMWHEGKLVLTTDETKSGMIKYDQLQGIVQVKNGNKILTYSAKSIFHFEIYDILSESHREFYVLPYGLVSSYKTPVIFEVLVEGKLTLLSREYVVIKNVQNPYSFGSYSREVLVYDYFFLDKNGNITKYTMKKRDLLLALSKRENQVDEFMKANRLHHDRRNDLVRIIAFYNALL